MATARNGKAQDFKVVLSDGPDACEAEILDRLVADLPPSAVGVEQPLAL